jgi:hypothetical protein
MVKKTKKAKPSSIISKVKKPTVKEQLATLAATIREYFKQVRYRKPEDHQIKLQAVVVQGDGTKRDGVFNVASLIAAVLTAQGLGKEVRLEAEQTPQGGTLYVRFYSPVRVDGIDMLA